MRPPLHMHSGPNDTEHLQLERYAEAPVPTRFGPVRAVVFRDHEDAHGSQPPVEHLALLIGDPKGEDIACAVHSECLTGEVLGSAACDCRQRVDRALRTLMAAGNGVLVYLRREQQAGLASELSDVIASASGGPRSTHAQLQPKAAALAHEMLAQLGIGSIALVVDSSGDSSGASSAEAAVLRSAGVRVTRAMAPVAK